MKEFTKKIEVKQTWQAGKWGEVEHDLVQTLSPGRLLRGIRHESQIEKYIPDAPDDLKEHVRKEVMAHRELAENENRCDGYICKMSVTAEGLFCRWPPDTPSFGSMNYSRNYLETDVALDDDEFSKRCLDYLDKQWRPVKGAEEWEVRRGPADGKLQVLVGGDVIGTFFFYSTSVQLRWHEGKAQSRRCGDEAEWTDWTNWKWGRGHDWEKRAECWFRKHCPSDRFVMDNGEVLEFRLKDDGEAFAVGQEYIPTDPNISGDLTAAPWRAALYRFRDTERDKRRSVTLEGPGDKFFILEKDD